ncbi:MAG: aminoglycoside/hydroxyurea antibiotic resistance kinase [Candidatus Improbicoccus devescovinae]|nr:MAG: aminoglycoside/hydroxyurea antibiotic resistance kinase [Candidatus Improbicoccus devescovinae]
MIDLPDKYKEKIISMFGTENKIWLDNVNTLVDKYVKKFNLKNIKVTDNLSYNVVLFAKCEKFGDLVLKIGLPDNKIFNEIVALKKYDGKGACKCHYSNKEDRLMILERLIPGETSHKIKNREERIKIFCDVASNLILKEEKNLQLPTYREVLDKAFIESEKEPEKYKLLKKLIQAADNFYKEIESINLSKFLLHGDLYHDNILTTADGRKAIDPKGIIGERVLETARFIENEIEKQEINLEVIELMAKYYKEDKNLICKSVFIDSVLSFCWYMEGNLGNEKSIVEAVKNLQSILNFLNQNDI